MASLSMEIGYYPHRLQIDVGDIRITTLAEHDESVQQVQASPRVEGAWIFAPANFRIFPMPKTHRLEHANADGPEHLEFLIWTLSFLTGMRLTQTEAGFVDATPIKSHELVDFIWLNDREVSRGLGLAEAFWKKHRNTPKAAQCWGAAVHALFLAQYPRALQYERMLYLFAAVDACYRLSENTGVLKVWGHPSRIPGMCAAFGIPLPTWAQNPGSEITSLRHGAIHEALFMGKPLGFANHDRKSAENLPLEVGNLVCRFLAALLGATGTQYVRTPVSIYMAVGLDI